MVEGIANGSAELTLAEVFITVSLSPHFSESIKKNYIYKKMKRYAANQFFKGVVFYYFFVGRRYIGCTRLAVPVIAGARVPSRYARSGEPSAHF